MSRRHPGNHTIPDNPHWIEFPRTDGSTAHLPKNTTKIVDSEGQVNYMRPVAMDESLAIMWRVAVGTAMAARMNMPSELLSVGCPSPSLMSSKEGPNYVLKSFPKGYQLYDHNKGPVNAPRHDPYLCGTSSRFQLFSSCLTCMQVLSMSTGFARRTSSYRMLYGS